MDTLTAVLVLLMLSPLALHAQELPVLEQTKPLYLRTDLVTDGTPAAAIVAPEAAEWQPVVERLQARCQELTGSELPVLSPTDATPAELGARNLIAIGNVPDNPFVERLYVEYFIRDVWRPGNDGMVVRSIHNPHSTGHNVVLVGAGSPQVALTAVDALLGALEHEGRSLAVPGYLLEFGPDHEAPVLSEETKAGHAERTAEQVSFNNGRNLISGAASMATSYANTGSPDYVELFKLHMDRHEELSGPGEGTHMNLWEAIIAWDRIEESPLFSNEDRLRITNRLLYLLRSKEGANYGFFKTGIEQGGVRHNHQTLPGLDAFFGGRYIQTWGLQEEGEQYQEWARRLFTTQSQFHKPMCDSNQYEWTTLQQTATWALASGDTTIFDNGQFRTAADRAVIAVNNLSESTRTGDCWTAWSFPLDMMRLAAWRYRDGRYQWMIEEHYGAVAPVVDDLVRGVESEEPSDLLGIAVAPMDTGFYRLHDTVSDEPAATLPLEQCFDKLSFRTSFDPKDEYLLLDGIGMGSHGHFDTNGIGEMTANERTWLVDMSYTEGPNMRDHNTITVLRDGMGVAAPPLASLDSVADLDQFGLTQTSVPGYNGLDWRRHILWRKGGYFLVVDELEALEDGGYTTRCYWRSLGEPELAGPDLRVTQQIREAEESVDVVEMEGASGGRAVEYLTTAGMVRWPVTLAAGEWTLTVAGRGSHPGNDSFFADLDGERIGELHVSQTGLGPNSLVFTVADGGEHELAVTLREAPGTVLDRMELAGPNGAAFTIEAEEAPLGPPEGLRADALTIASAGAQSLSMVRDSDNFGKWWTDYPYAEPIVNILQQQTSGVMQAGEIRSFANLLSVSGTGSERNYDFERYENAWAIRDGETGEVTLFALRPGESLAGLETDAAAVALGPNRIVARDVTRLNYGPISLRSDAPVSIELDEGGSGVAVAQQPTRITIGDRAQQLPPGRTEFTSAAAGPLATQLQATIAALRPTERLAAREMPFTGTQGVPVRWEAQTGSPALTVAVGDLAGDGKRRVIVGCEDGRVRLLDDAGTALWEFEARGKINSVCTADMDGDGLREIIAGSDDRNCYCLGRDGKVLWSYEGAATDNPYWRRYWKAGEVEKVIAADIDGDGRDEVAFGAANMNLNALDQDGSLLWRYSKYGVITSLIAHDLTGDGRMEVIGGPAKITCISEVSVLDAEGTKLGGHGNDGWASALTALAIAELDGPGSPAVICGTNFNNVFAHDNNGGQLTNRWQVPLGDVVTALCGVDFAGDGRDLVVAGSGSEYVYCLAADGSMQWATPVGGPVLRLLAVPSGEGAAERVIAVTDSAAVELGADGRAVAWLTGLSGVTDATWADGLYLCTNSGSVIALER